MKVVGDDQAVAGAVERLRRDAVLGFDTETKPCFRKGEFHLPSLIQLASGDAVCLFQIRALSFPNPLSDLLSDESVLKVGVGIGRDLAELREVFPFQPAGFLGLEEPARDLGFEAAGLRTLAAVLFGFRISKGAQTSNWERNPLTSKQIRYAATDAWVGRKIFLRLIDLAGGEMPESWMEGIDGGAPAPAP